jgi:hypothetical protein
MPTYKVSRLIRSAALFRAPCEIDGIALEPLGEPSERVLAWESVAADRFHDASKIFDQHLLTVADAFTVIAGAALAPAGASTLIEKARSKYVFVKAVRRRSATSMSIWPDFSDVLDRSTGAAIALGSDRRVRNAAHYLRQGGLTETLTTATFHALQAGEALCTTQRKKTDHAQLRQLLGSNLYDYFYRSDAILGENRRNALAHGRIIEETGLQPVTQQLQELLLDHVRSSLGGQTWPAFSPIRGFTTYETHVVFLERLDNPIRLENLHNALTKGQIHSQSDPRLVGSVTSRRLWRRW